MQVDMANSHSRSESYQFTSPYPEPQYYYPTSHSKISVNTKSSINERASSPTPSELEEISQPWIPKQYFKPSYYKKPKYIRGSDFIHSLQALILLKVWIIILVIILVFTALITIYHKQIETWLRPAANWMQSLKFGWLIPVAILFVISFPPLFGHEIVAVLCGNVWGLWKGFGIVILGTMLGEIGNF